MMRIAIAGGGMVGLMLARLLRLRGFEPMVFERMQEGAYVPRGYMLGYQGFPPFEELGVLHQIRESGWDIAPREDGSTVAIAVNVGTVLHLLARDLPVEYEHVVVDLVRDGADRVVGVVVEGPEGRREVAADLVVACDGINSPVREMAGLEAKFDPIPDATIQWMTSSKNTSSFAMRYFSDGGHIGTLAWPEGSAGWRSIDKVGRDAALAPGVEAIKQMFIDLLPEAEAGIQGLTSTDQIRYGEPQLLSCPKWWIPGLLLIGDSAHFFGPETGASSGIGLGDAQALAEAIKQNPDDPDAACANFEMWRAPAVRPLEAMDPSRQRMLTHGQIQPRPEERWPPAG
jgi:2-polyprenyl-6-methoxyphenol hydroxylase-like FAD-dependent oxidoreductase